MQTSFDKSRIKVLLLEGIHPNAQDTLAAAGYENVTALDHALSGPALTAALAEHHMLGIRSRTQLTGEVLGQAQRLMAVGCFCIGTNQVEVDVAADLAIPVFNAPFSNTRSVAELVLAEAILLLRGVPERSMQMHVGNWQKSAKASFEVRGKTLGIVGYGNIGAQLGVLGEALGMQVRFYDIERKLQLGNARQVDRLSDLLRMADVVSLHVPATAETRMLIDAEAIGCMQETAVLINASRGNVVDLDALAQRLRDGRLRGAAIDVFPSEPASNGEGFESPLRQAPNVILTPHIGGSTVEAQANIGSEVADKLVRYSDNGSTASAVNFPEVTLPAHPGKHRLLHIHRNVPGVLGAINQVLSAANINIAAQYLMTKGNIGYVVVDVDRQYSEQALQALRDVSGTLRTRVLF